MKAALYSNYGQPDVVQIKEIENPSPGEKDILVKNMATTVTAVDSIFRNGDQFFARMATGISKPKKSLLGFEFAGVVEEVGSNVNKFKKGDNVYGAFEGTHAEYLLLHEDSAIVHKPDIIDFEEAAAIPSGALTALPFLRDEAKIKKNMKVLIIGASGSVGSYAVQLAKYFEAEVTGVCSTSNIELVKSLGADFVIDYTQENFTKNPQKYDVIFDSVGKSSYKAAKNSLVKEGIYLTTVVNWTILFQMLITSKLSSKKAAISFTGMRKNDMKIKDLSFINEMIENKKLKAVVDKTFSLDEISKAYEYVDGGHKKGNVVVKILNENN